MSRIVVVAAKLEIDVERGKYVPMENQKSNKPKSNIRVRIESQTTLGKQRRPKALRDFAICLTLSMRRKIRIKSSSEGYIRSETSTVFETREYTRQAKIMVMPWKRCKGAERKKEKIKIRQRAGQNEMLREAETNKTQTCEISCRDVHQKMRSDDSGMSCHPDRGTSR